MRFVHCSDIHLFDLAGTWPHEFLNKRMTGAVNLLMKRRRRHDDRRFEAIKQAAVDLGADRLIITGDLTNLSLRSEFRKVAASLAAAGLPVTVIPGNHDAYVRSAHEGGWFQEHLGAFMPESCSTHGGFPFVERAHPGVAFIGVSSAVPTPPMIATGRVGAAQLEALGEALDACAAEGRLRVVLIHHPPVDGVSKPKHDLLDRADFAAVIAAHGAELVLHGHEHRELHTALSGPDKEVPVYGVPAGTSIDARAGREGGFACFDLVDGAFTRMRYAWDGEGFSPVDVAAHAG